jgi:hypothetical protein
MKPRPIKIQFGATHWNPNGKPDWYKKAEGRWMGYSEEDSRWIFVASITVSFPLIPVEELMAQPPEWNGEGLPPFGVDCEITTKTILGAVEYEGIGMFIAQTMDYYVMLMQSDRTPWIRSKDRVTFRPLKTEREKAIAAMSKVISEACDVDDLDPVESRKQLGALYDKGYRRVGNE